MSKEKKKAKDESLLTFDELAWEFERVHEIRDRVNRSSETRRGIRPQPTNARHA